MTKIDQYLINQVKRLRTERGITQAIIADHLKVSPGFVGQVESGLHRAKWKLEHINQLAKLFRCSPRDFFPEKPLRR